MKTAYVCTIHDRAGYNENGVCPNCQIEAIKQPIYSCPECENLRRQISELEDEISRLKLELVLED
jgi:hypothetical protein